MISTKDFRRKLKIEIDGEPFEIIKCQHVKPGKGVAFVKTTLKSLLDGHVEHENFRSGDTVDTPQLETREMEYLYQEDPHFIFMDTETYEQRELDKEMLGENIKWLKEGETVQFALYQGKIVDMEVPKAVDRTVIQTDPGLRGDTAQGGSKPATIEGGAVVEVPLFVKQGDCIRVDTRSGEYVSRVDT